MKRVKKQVVPFDKYFNTWDALDKVIEAWETLPGGVNHGPRDIEKWLADHMSPAINNARKVMGRKAPNERPES